MENGLKMLHRIKCKPSHKETGLNSKLSYTNRVGNVKCGQKC